MNDPRGDDRHRLYSYLIATLAWSWAWFIPTTRYLAAHGLAGAPWYIYLGLLLGGWGPSLMGLWFTWRAEGPAGPRRLLRSLVAWRLAPAWYLAALGLPTLITLAGVLLHLARGGDLGAFTPGRLALAPVAFLFALPIGPLGEELGWRGYALPRLLERFHPVTASVGLGLVWTLWHVPLFWAPAGTSISGHPVTMSAVVAYAGVLIANSLLYTWVWVRVGGSVLLAVLLHAAFNADLPLLPFPDRSPEASLAVFYATLFPSAALAAWLVTRLRQASTGRPGPPSGGSRPRTAGDPGAGRPAG